MSDIKTLGIFRWLRLQVIRLLALDEAVIVNVTLRIHNVNHVVVEESHRMIHGLTVKNNMNERQEGFNRSTHGWLRHYNKPEQVAARESKLMALRWQRDINESAQ